MAPVVLRLRERPERFDTLLVSTGQHREMLDQTLADFGLTPDHDLGLMTAGQTLPELTSRAMSASARLLETLKPDAVLVQGDTTTAMVCAMAAFYLKVPVGHVEAGLRTFDRYQPFPEEVNRRLISSLATWHYAPTWTAVQALAKEGIAGTCVVQSGNTVIDALLHMENLVGNDLSRVPRPFVLVTAHRRENLGQPITQICLALRDLVQRNPGLRVVYPVHMNPAVRSVVDSVLGNEENVLLTPPVSYRELVRLMKGCELVLTDSGGIQEEAPALGKPVLVLREVTERPEAVTAGTVKVVGTDRARILEEAERLLHDPSAYAEMARAVSPYGDGHAALRIAQHLAEKAPAQAAVEATKQPAR